MIVYVSRVICQCVVHDCHCAVAQYAHAPNAHPSDISYSRKLSGLPAEQEVRHDD